MFDQAMAEAARRLREINRIVRTPTPQGTKAYTHFMRDFDQIRELTKPYAARGPEVVLPAGDNPAYTSNEN